MDKLESFTKRYGTFNDATINEISYILDYRNPQLKLVAETLNIIDSDFETVTIFFYNVIEFKFFEPKGSHNHKAIWDCNFLYLQEGYAFDFNPWAESTKYLEEIRKSNFYVLCKDFSFEFKKD